MEFYKNDRIGIDRVQDRIVSVTRLLFTVDTLFFVIYPYDKIRSTTWSPKGSLGFPQEKS